MNKFFDRHPRFFESEVGGHSKRLNARYKCFMEYRPDLIQNKTILDIASHDGRWSFAALHNQAKYVVGIDANQQSVNRGREIFAANNIDTNRYSLIHEDINYYLLSPSGIRFDTVFLLGFFYHIHNHCSLLKQILRLYPKHIILDTNIVNDEQPVIAYRNIDIYAGSNQFGYKDGSVSLEGVPSRAYLYTLFSYLNLNKVEEYKWTDHFQTQDLPTDYKNDTRATFFIDV